MNSVTLSFVSVVTGFTPFPPLMSCHVMSVNSSSLIQISAYVLQIKTPSSYQSIYFSLYFFVYHHLLFFVLLSFDFLFFDSFFFYFFFFLHTTELLLYDNRMVLECLLPFHYIQNDSVKLEILRAMKSNYAEKGRCIMKQGEAGGGIVFLLSGRAVVSREKVWKKPWVAKRDTYVRFKSNRSTYTPVQTQGRGLGLGAGYGSRGNVGVYGVGVDGSRGGGQGQGEGAKKYQTGTGLGILAGSGSGIRSTMTRMFRLNGDGSQDSLESSVHSARHAQAQAHGLTPVPGRGGGGRGEGGGGGQGQNIARLVVGGSPFTDKRKERPVNESRLEYDVRKELNDLSTVAGDGSDDNRSVLSATVERQTLSKELSVKEMTLKQPTKDAESHGLPGVPGLLSGVSDSKDSEGISNDGNGARVERRYSDEGSAVEGNNVTVEDSSVGDAVRGYGREGQTVGAMRGGGGEKGGQREEEGVGGREGGEGGHADAIPLSNIHIVMKGPFRDTSTSSLPLSSSLSSSSSSRPLVHRKPSVDTDISALSTPTPSPASSQRLKYANSSLGGSMSNLFTRNKNIYLTNFRQSSVSDIKPTHSEHSHIRESDREEEVQKKRVNKDRGIINDVERENEKGVIKASKRRSFLSGVGKYVYQAVDTNGAKSRSQDDLGGVKEEVLGILRKGDFIGHNEVRNLSKLSFSLTASEACWYYTLDHADVLTSMRSNPRVALEFQRALGLSIEEMDKRLMLKCKQQGWIDFFSDMKEDYKKSKKVNGEKKWNVKNGGFSTLFVQYKPGNKTKTKMDDVSRFDVPKECSPKDRVSLKPENVLLERDEYVRSLRNVKRRNSNESNKGIGITKEDEGEAKNTIDGEKETKESEEEEKRENEREREKDMTEEMFGITGIDIGQPIFSNGMQGVERGVSDRYKRGRLATIFSTADRHTPFPPLSSRKQCTVSIDSPSSRLSITRKTDKTGGSSKTTATLDRLDRMQKMYLEDSSSHGKGSESGIGKGSGQGADVGACVGVGYESATVSARRGYTFRSFSSLLRSSTKSPTPPSSSYPLSPSSASSPTDKGTIARTLHIPFPRNIFKRAKINKTEREVTNESANESGGIRGQEDLTVRDFPPPSFSSLSALNCDTTHNTQKAHNVGHNNAHALYLQSPPASSLNALRYDTSGTPGVIRSRESRIFIKANRSSADILSVHEIGLDHYQDCRTVLKRSLSSS